jgi:hypothetical protein
MKFLLLLFISCFYFQSFSQPHLVPEKGSYEYHLKKRKARNTAAWILLGSGTVMSVAGISWDSRNVPNEDNAFIKGSSILKICGIASLALSVPYFISSRKHKKRALEIKNQPAATLNPGKFRQVPGVTFKLSL